MMISTHEVFLLDIFLKLDTRVEQLMMLINVGGRLRMTTQSNTIECLHVVFFACLMPEENLGLILMSLDFRIKLMC